MNKGSEFLRFAGLAVALAFASTPVAHATDAALVDAARRDGQLVWYTTQIVEQLSKPLGEAFQRAYNIKVDYVRADAAESTRRMLAESAAGKMRADVFDAVGAPVLARHGLVMDYVPDSARRLPKRFVDPAGHWVATNLYVYTLGVNTDLVPPGEIPRRFEDLLAPKWKGRMGWSGRASTSSASGFIGAVFSAMGETKGRDYLRALAKQDIAPVTVSARQLLDQTIAGEYAIAIEIVNSHAAISAGLGAPVVWAPLERNLTALSVLSATRDAPHPNAAKLFLDFAMSPAGQAIYRDHDYLAVDPDIAPRQPNLRLENAPDTAFQPSPEEVEDMIPRWFAVYREIFR